MKTRILNAVLVAVLCALGAAAAQAPVTSPAERRAREYVRLVDRGTRADLQKYVQENLTGQVGAIPMERHLNFFSSLQDSTRGLTVHSVQDAKENEVTLLLQSKLTGQWMALFVRVEPEAPNRIVSIGTRPPRPPAGAALKNLTPKQMGQELGAFVKKLADADVFSGAVLLAYGGVPVFQGAYGVANKDFNVPNNLDTKFNLGSMNKMLTAVSIAQLVEKGKLSFDDPLSKFLPDFPDAESAQKIKIKHLLSHTAGLGGYFSEKWFESSRELYRSVDDMMKRAAADEKLLFEPGSRWQYSNTGMLVLGKVIEKVSGQSYFDYIRDHITQPAKMPNTGCYELDQVNRNLAVGYEKQFGDNGPFYINNIFSHVIRGGPQGGCYSTVADLLQFDRALRGNQLVGAELLRQLLSAKPELNSPNYGFGFQIETQPNIAGHGGGFLGISANLDMFLGTGWTAIVLSNYGQGARPVQEKMRELVKAAAPASGAR